MLIVNSVHLFQHSTNAEQWSLELEQLTKDPAQISVQVFINASGQIKKILPYALVDRKVQYTVTSVLLLILQPVGDSEQHSGEHEQICEAQWVMYCRTNIANH